MVEITVKNGKYQCKGITTRTRPNSFFPEWTEFVPYDFPNLSYNRNLLNINDYLLVPVSVFEQNQTKIILEAYRNNKLKWRSYPMPLVHISTAKLNGKEEYLFALQNYYSTLDKETSIRPYVYAVDAQGMYAKWRGSALAFPLLDAYISPHNSQVLCALHRGDSYIALSKENTDTRIMAYQWNGFGFSGLDDSIACKYCVEMNLDIVN